MDAAEEQSQAWKSEYVYVREVPGLGLCGIQQMVYTTGLMVGLDPIGYHWRYCYEHWIDATKALFTWDGQGDPPGPWIKLKGHPDGERLGPGATGRSD